MSAKVHSVFSALSPMQKHESAVLAQQELFIRLGNMPEIPSDENFIGLLSLGNALIEGDLAEIQKALAFYVDRGTLINDHCEYLRQCFASAGVSFQEPAILRYDTPIGQHKSAVVISIMLERAGKIAFISSDPSSTSYVHTYTYGKNGMMMLEPAKEDPGLLLKQISRIIRLPDVVAPPPMYLD